MFKPSAIDTTHTPGGIPKVIHKIWLGSQPLSPKYVAYDNSWRFHNPGWKIVWWFDKDVESLTPFKNIELFKKSTNLGERSDFMRYEILRSYGGVYVDTDVECLRSLDGLLDSRDISCFVGTECFNKLEGRDIYGNAVIGCTPFHEAMNDVVESLEACVAKSYEENIGLLWQVVKGSGPFFLTRVLDRHKNVTVFPSTYFYPGFSSETFRSFASRSHGTLWKMLPDAKCVHHWDNTWLSGGSSSSTEDSSNHIANELKQVKT